MGQKYDGRLHAVDVVVFLDKTFVDVVGDGCYQDKHAECHEYPNYKNGDNDDDGQIDSVFNSLVHGSVSICFSEFIRHLLACPSVD